mmetsp:Transcript_56523/g.103791  ORF Transcript_56523/g.103791 Transcript_56523/m.103791 type:complete len:789 (-) Transcript_56523:95-2461(-)
MDAAARSAVTVTESGRSDGYRPDIDGLRAIAVLSVMLYHVDKAWLPGGFLGVDIFFVISGFVVTSSLAEHMGKSSDESVFVAFYARRAKRLMPASLFMISLVATSMTFFIPPWFPTWTQRYFSSGRFALVSWSNNYFAGFKDSYFDSGDDSLESNPFTHTWSLGVEEQFYLLFPLVLVAAFGTSLQMLQKTRHQLQLRAISVLSAVSACSLLTAWILPARVAFYLLPSRLWELASGALLFEVLSSGATADSQFGPFGRYVAIFILQVFALVLMGSSLLLSPHGVTYSLPVVLPAVCGALCFIAAGGTSRARLNTALSYWPIVYVGKISYPLYLFHWPLFVYCKWSFGLASLRSKLVCLAICMVLGAFTYHVVERPFRTWRPKRSWTVLPIMGVGILLVYGWLVALERPLQGAFWKMPQYAAQPHAVSSRPHVFAALGARQQEGTQCGCRLVDTTWHSPPCAKVGLEAENLAPCFVETPPSCWVEGEGTQSRCAIFTEQNQTCIDGSCLRLIQGEKPKTIHLLGDSTAGDMAAGLKKAAAGHFVINELHRGGCAYAPEIKHDDGVTWAPNVPRGLCEEIIKNATTEIARSVGQGDLVVLSNKNFKHLTSQQWIKDFLTLLDTLYKAVSARRGNLLLLGPRQTLPANGASCVPTLFDRNRAARCEMPLETSKKQVWPLLQILHNFTLGKHGVAVFDYHELLCDDRTCSAFVPGTKTLAFRDDFHLTKPGSEYLAPYICAFLNSHDMFPKRADAAIEARGMPAKATGSTSPSHRHEGRRLLRHSSGRLVDK